MILAVDIDWLGLLTLAIGTSGGSALILAYVNRRKTSADVEQVRADTAQTIVEASAQLVTSMQDRLDRLRKDTDDQIADLCRRLTDLEQRAARDRRLLLVAVGHIRDQDAAMRAASLTPLPIPADLEGVVTR